MHQSLPLLSICIPTYNRAEKLRRLLLGLHGCTRSLGAQIEIIISDNCSTDSTEQVVQDLSKEIAINYFRQSSNIGPTKNYLFVLTKSKADYCWVTGDDDVVDTRELVNLVNHLKSHRLYSLLVVDTLLVHCPTSKLIDMRFSGPCASTHVFLAILKKSLYPFGHYTSLVFNRALVLNAVTSVGANQAELGFWPHQFLLLHILWFGRMSCYIYPRSLAMQGIPLSSESMSIIRWTEFEANRLSVISCKLLHIPKALKLCLIARELYSLRLLRHLLLIAVILPSSKYPFYFDHSDGWLNRLGINLVHIPPRLVFSVATVFFSVLNRYSRLYVRLCNKYGVHPSSSRRYDSPRYLIEP